MLLGAQSLIELDIYSFIFKIIDRIKEHKRDCRKLSDATALSELNKTDELIIHFKEATKIAQYNSVNYAKGRDAIKIILNKNSCNKIERAKIDGRWRHLLKSREEDAQKIGTESQAKGWDKFTKPTGYEDKTLPIGH